MKPVRTAGGGSAARIAGYALGAPTTPRAPMDVQELETLKRALMWTPQDEEALRRAAPILEPHVDEILDVWYGFIGSQPELIAAFTSPTTGKPDQAYLERVRARFGQWIRDTLAMRQDQGWLDYQFEIGRRHFRTGKNRTDDADAPPVVPLRYILALVAPVTYTMRPFLQRGASGAELERMLEAWHKTVLLQVTLWAHAYVEPQDF